MARQSLQKVKLAVRTCGLVYGRSPCEALFEGQVTRDYDWTFNGSIENFVIGQNCTLTPTLAGMQVINTSTSGRFQTPAGLGIDGATNYMLEIEFTRVARGVGSTFLGHVGFLTDEPGDSIEVYTEYGAFEDAEVGERVRRTINFSTEPTAGTNWTSWTVNIIRFAFDDNSPGSEFIIHNIRIGHAATAEEATGTDRCFNTRATCQDLDHFDAEPLLNDALGSKIESYKASPGAATVNLASRPLGAILGADTTRSYVASLSVYRAAGDTSLTSAKVAGRSVDILGQVWSGGAGAILIECPWLTTEVSGTVSLTFAASIDHLGLVSYDVRNATFAQVDTDSGVTADHMDLDVEKADWVVAASTGWLMDPFAWTGVVENTEDTQSSMRFGGADDQIDTSLPVPGYDVDVTSGYLAGAVPTLVATYDIQVIDTGDGFQSSFSANANAGDILIMAMETHTNSAVLPSGWAHMPGSPKQAESVNSWLSYLWKRQPSTGSIFGGVETQFSTDTNHTAGVLAVFRGVRGTGNPWEEIITPGSSASSTSISIPGLTTTVENSLVVDVMTTGADSSAAQFSGYTNASLESLTEVNQHNVADNSGGGVAMTMGIKATPGAVSATTATLALSDNKAYVKFALAPTTLSDSKMASIAARFTKIWTPVGTEAEMMFDMPSDYRPQDADAFPNLESVSHKSAKINPGVDLGTRARLECSFVDMPTSDAGTGLDPYYDLRDYNPYTQGSFWPKFRSRQPFIRGAELTWYLGEAGQTLSEMESRLFLVDNFSGPTESGSFKIVGLDPLKMLDGDKAQCPVLSEGRLLADVTNVATSFTVTPTGIGESYPVSGYLAIGGSESMSFTRVGDVFTVVRGQLNSVAEEHTAGDRVQLVKVFDSMDVADIIRELMVDYAYVPDAWIPLADWLAETDAYLNRAFTAYIAEPTSVNKLVAELMEQAGLSIWWDSIAELIRLRVLRAISTDVEFFDEGLYGKNSFRINEQQDKRVSQVWTFFGQKNPLLSVDDKNNYRSSVLTIDVESEADYQSSEIKKIYSRWIGEGGRSAAERVNGLIISRYRIPPRLFSFELVRDAQGNPELGAGYTIGHRVLQTASGAADSIPSQAVSVSVSPDRFRVEAEEFNYASVSEEDLLNRSITIDANTYDINCRTLHDDLYTALRTGDNVHVIIEPFIVVGSTSISTPALNIGTWPTLVRTGTKASTGNGIITGLSDTSDLVVGLRVMGTGIQSGAKIASIDSGTQITLDKNSTSTGSVSLTFALVNLTIENRGLVQGKGGNGGKGANDGGNAGSGGKNGEAGGTGLYARYPFTYIDEDADGTNGGGGGGAGGSCADFDDHRGGGGGGGAGSVAGTGGVGPGNGEEGQNGTLVAGGAGGRSYTSSTFWSPPELKSNVRGGDGGAPGQAGSNDVNNYDVSGGSPGAAGVAIDGIAYVNTQGATGTRLGASV